MDEGSLRTGGGPEAFEELARAPNDPGAAALRPGPAGWGAVWLRRRGSPAAPFDEYFLGEPSGLHRPPRLSASQIERGVKDPATLWFDAVLGVRRVEWRPFSRARRKSVGIAAHRVLAAALRGPPAEGGSRSFRSMPWRSRSSRGACGFARKLAFGPLLGRLPHGRVRGGPRPLGQVYALPISGFIAVEAPIPEGAGVLPSRCGAVRVTGRTRSPTRRSSAPPCTARLRTLEANGNVVSEWETDNSGPARRVYKLTRQGEQHLQEWAAVLDHVAKSMSRFVKTTRSMASEVPAAKVRVKASR